MQQERRHSQTLSVATYWSGAETKLKGKHICDRHDHTTRYYAEFTDEALSVSVTPSGPQIPAPVLLCIIRLANERMFFVFRVYEYPDGEVSHDQWQLCRDQGPERSDPINISKFNPLDRGFVRVARTAWRLSRSPGAIK